MKVMLFQPCLQIKLNELALSFYKYDLILYPGYVGRVPGPVHCLRKEAKGRG